MKKLYFSILLSYSSAMIAQHHISGYVITKENTLPLKGAIITVSGSKTAILTDEKGFFDFQSIGDKLKITVSHSGYQTEHIDVAAPLVSPLKIVMAYKVNDIQEVTLSTGYQKIPKERATGSFTSIDERLINQQVGTNILDRLENMADGVVVDRGSSGSPQLMIRGISTINGPKSPLVVVDNFPYDGDISNINPNMVENITILKDASAASIWGARAANGVIVITTKTAKMNQPLNIEWSWNMGISQKPGFGNLKTISSSDFIDVEKRLFQQGFYDSDITSPSHPVLSPVVDLLNKERNGELSSAYVDHQITLLKGIDASEQFRRYVYQPAEKRQYYLGISGGAPSFSWVSSMGYDDNVENLGETYKRVNLRFQNTWKPLKNLNITTGVYYTESKTKSGKKGYGNVIMGKNSFVPYMQLADNQGNPMPVFKDFDQNYKDSYANAKIEDWNYYPLADWKHDRVETLSSEIIVNAGLSYQIIKGLNAEVKYQYQRLNDDAQHIYGAQSYYARNYVNRFAQVDDAGNVVFVVPKGAILDQSLSSTGINNMRGQLTYDKKWGRHSVSAIAGGESRDAVRDYSSNRYYGYDEDRRTSSSIDYTHQYPLLTSGSMEFIQRLQDLGKRSTRFVSLFTNAAYTYNDRYTVSGSLRKDASNLFGLATNDQWNPFWSVGGAWEISKENFYGVDVLPYLKLRGSYGFNGNVNPGMVAVSTIVYDPENSWYTGTPMARFDNYYNPRLRWETSRMMNVAVDFSLRNNRLSGSLEYFTKRGSNLFGQAQLDYTTGIDYMLSNVAETKGHGIDIELNSKNIDRALKWNTVLNFSTFRDEVAKYYLADPLASQFIGNGSSVPVSGVEGRPVYSIFAYKWAGLDPQTGDPRGYLNGEISKDYSALIGAGTSVQDLEFFGSAIPTMYGSFINSLSYKNLTLDIGVTYKFGYFFRRSSINYTNLYDSWTGHSDYSLRWQKPGDELSTNVPSAGLADANRDAFYNGAAILVEKGDHVRLQYINLSYRLDKNNFKTKAFKNLSVFTNLSNIGILWRANKKGIDPDYNMMGNMLTPPMMLTFGVRSGF